MFILRREERAKHSLWEVSIRIVPYNPEIFYLGKLWKYPNNYTLCENHWLCSLSKSHFMKHVCINVWLKFSTMIFLCAMNNSLYHFPRQDCYQFGIGAGLKRVKAISKTSFCTSHDCAIFWNYPGRLKGHETFHRGSIGCVSRVFRGCFARSSRLKIDTAYNKHRLMGTTIPTDLSGAVLVCMVGTTFPKRG